MTRRRWFGVLVVLAALGASAGDMESLMSDGERLFKKQEYGKALRVFIKARNTDPSNLEAKEYIDRCTEKIVEQEAGRRIRAAAKSARTSTATIEPGQPVPAWAAPSQRTRVAPVRRKPTRPKRRMPSDGSQDAPTPGKNMIIQREQLAEDYQRRILGDSPVRIEKEGNRTDVLLYMNRLFLPFKDILSPDALPYLTAAAQELRAKGANQILLRAVDTMTPVVRHNMLDLPSRRCATVFTFFVRAGLAPATSASATYTADDLDD